MRYSFLLFLLLLSAPWPVRAQLRFSDAFDNGRLDSVTVDRDTLTMWPVEALHAVIMGSQGRSPVIRLFKGQDYRLRSRHRLVWRHRLDDAWVPFDTARIAGDWYDCWNREAFAADSVFIAYWPAYQYEDVRTLVQRVSASPFGINVGSRGVTTRGRDIFGYGLTDPTIPDGDKARIVFIARQHCVEAPGNHLVEGITEFLLSDAPDAAALRRRATVFVYPMVSPDLVFHGCREDRGGYGSTNRQWAPGVPDSLPTGEGFEAALLRRVIMDECDGRVDFGFDIHSHPGHLGPWYWWGAKQGADSAVTAELVRLISLRDGGWPGGAVIDGRVAQDLLSTSCDCADHWLYHTAGAIAYTFEPGSVPWVSVQRIRDAGASICLGLLDLLRSTTALRQNLRRDVALGLTSYPVPARDHTVITVSLPSFDRVSLTMHDLLGRRVRTLVENEYGAGKHSVVLQAGAFARGFYILRLVTSQASITHRIIIP